MKRALTFLVLTSPALVACQGLDLGDLVPRVNFERFDVHTLDWDGADVDFVFKVENPNPVGFTVDRFAYDLAFQEVSFLNGDDPGGLELLAGDASELALPVGLVWADLWDLVQALRGEDEVSFRLQGGFGFDTSVGPVDVLFDDGGSFPAPRKPAMDFGRLRVDELDLLGARLALELETDNDHGSVLSFLTTTFAVEAGGISLGGGVQESLGDVPGATTAVFELPLEVDFIDVGTAAYDLLTGNDLELSLEASTDVDTPFGLLPLEVKRAGQVELY